MITIKINQTYYMEMLVTDSNGNGVNGLSIPFKIYRSQGGLLYFEGTMIDGGEGLYVHVFVPQHLGQFRVIYLVPLPYGKVLESLNCVS